MKNFWNKARLSDKILIGLVVTVLIGWSAHANLTNGGATENPTQTAENQTPTMITVIEARELAIDLVGGGVINDLSLNTEEAIPTFDIIVYHDREEFQIILDATSGSLIRLESLTTPEPVALAAVEVAGNLTAEEAISLAREHLSTIGITDATLVYSYSDTEDGIAVWSIEFRYNGRDLEFYVVKASGEFLKSPAATNNNNDNNNSGSGNGNNNNNGNHHNNGGGNCNSGNCGNNNNNNNGGNNNNNNGGNNNNNNSGGNNNNNNNNGGGNNNNNTPAATEISRERAGEIALAIAPGRLVEVSRDWERGRPAWWVEIRHEGMVHEFYIDMETGAVLQHEVEVDD